MNEHLSQIATAWTLVRQAHASHPDAVAAARERLVERYGSAIYRYLLGAVRDADAAAELFQEFALRLVRGDFHRADPERGRFRDFLKKALYHLIVDHQRRQSRRAIPFQPDAHEPIALESSPVDLDQSFADAWRKELIAKAWQALEQFERDTGQVLHTVLRLRTDHPEARSAQLAERLGAILGKQVTADWVRKRLFLARDKLTDFMIEEVEKYLDTTAPDDVAAELADLGLLEHCRVALERRRGATSREP